MNFCGWHGTFLNFPQSAEEIYSKCTPKALKNKKGQVLFELHQKWCPFLQLPAEKGHYFWCSSNRYLALFILSEHYLLIFSPHFISTSYKLCPQYVLAMYSAACACHINEEIKLCMLQTVYVLQKLCISFSQWECTKTAN